jgi:chromosomal replication initiation ATPase DnaA
MIHLHPYAASFYDPLKKDAINTDDIRVAICKIFNLPWNALTTRSRKYIHVAARQIFCKIIMDNNMLSYTNCGKLINRAHCNVIHSVKTANDRIIYDKMPFYNKLNFRQLYEKVKENIKTS